MILLENEQFRFSTPTRLVVGQKWDIDLLNPSDLQKRWFEIHYGTGQTPDILKFLEGFSGRWPCSKVFFCEAYLIDLVSLYAHGDFNVGQVREKVGGRYPGRFNRHGTEMSLLTQVGTPAVMAILSILVAEIQQLAEAA